VLAGNSASVTFEIKSDAFSRIEEVAQYRQEQSASSLQKSTPRVRERGLVGLQGRVEVLIIRIIERAFVDIGQESSLPANFRHLTGGAGQRSGGECSKLCNLDG
jgi:hypothetical protein